MESFVIYQITKSKWIITRTLSGFYFFNYLMWININKTMFFELLIYSNNIQ